MSFLHRFARTVRSVFMKEMHTPQKVHPFARFPEDKQNWFVANDKGIGGTSTGSIEVSEDNQGIVFNGKLAMSLPDKRMKTGYVALRLREFGAPIPLSFYDKISIHLKGDDRRYVITMRPVIAESHDQIYQAPILLRNPGQWETIDIPLETLQLTWRGKPVLRRFPVRGSSVESFGITIMDSVEDPFRLEIKSIDFKLDGSVWVPEAPKKSYF